MKKLLIIALALALAGCGGSGYLTSGPPTERVPGDTIPFTITAGAGLDTSDADVTKNISVGGSFDADGEGQSPGQSAVLSQCYFTWDDTTASTNTPVVALTDIGTRAADCANAGKSESNCCAAKTLVDDTGTHCTLYVECMVPNIPASNADNFVGYAHIGPRIQVDDFDPANAVVLEDGRRSFGTIGWDELENYGIMDNILVDDIGNSGSGWDLSLVDGNPTTEPILLAVSDAEDNLDAYQAGNPRDWRKYLTFSDKGTGLSQVIEFERQIMVHIDFDGITSGFSDFERDDVLLNWEFCDNRALDCGGVDEWTAFATLMTVKDASNNNLYNNASDMDLAKIGISYPYGPAYVSQINDSNIELSLADALLPGQNALSTELTYDADPANAAEIVLAENYNYQKMNFDLLIKDQVINRAGVNHRQDAPVLWAIESACAVCDDFINDVTLTDCFTDSISIAHDPAVANVTTAEAMSGTPPFVDYLVDASNNVLEIDESAIADGSRHVYVFSKADLTMSAAETATSEIYFPTIANLDDLAGGPGAFNNDAILVRLSDDTANAVYMGVEALDDGGAGSRMECVSFATEWQTDVLVVTSGGRVDCSAASQLKMMGQYDGQGGFVVSYDIFDAAGWQEISTRNALVASYISGNPEINIILPSFGASDKIVSVIVISSATDASDFSAQIDRVMPYNIHHDVFMETDIPAGMEAGN